MAESRIALVAIVVEDVEKSAEINTVLHEFKDYLVGRMGIPYRERGVAVISVVLDAPDDVTNSLSGKLGMIRGINVKTLYSKK